MRLIIGESSRVAQRFVARTPEVPTVAVGREHVSAWLGSDGAGQLASFLEQPGHEWDDVHIFTGATDPSAPKDALDLVNVQLPKLVLSFAETYGFSVNTYGTALEGLTPAPNDYVESKQRLSRLIDEFRGKGVDAMHIRFHTVFGASTPQPHMFLGQILSALVSGDDFNMSSGRQFREYQHVDDIAKAIEIVHSSRDSASITVSHGIPITLKLLAESIFESFNRLDSLKSGALPDQVPDVTAPLGVKTPQLEAMSFRDTIPTVVSYMHDAFGIAVRATNRLV